MPKVDPDSGQMLSDDPGQDDPEVAGGKVMGDYPKDKADTGHHSAISASPGSTDEGPLAPSEGRSGDMQNNPGGGSE